MSWMTAIYTCMCMTLHEWMNTKRWCYHSPKESYRSQRCLHTPVGNMSFPSGGTSPFQSTSSKPMFRDLKFIEEVCYWSHHYDTYSSSHFIFHLPSFFPNFIPILEFLNSQTTNLIICVKIGTSVVSGLLGVLWPTKHPPPTTIKRYCQSSPAKVLEFGDWPPHTNPHQNFT